MKNNNEKIEEMLKNVSFRELSNEEKNLVWNKIETKQMPLLSTLSALILNKNMITSLIVGLALALGLGGTAVVADNARPGDTLFQVDQTVENIRLKLASEEKKDELRIKFAEERVQEVEELTKENSSMERPTAEDISESSVSEIEVDIFQNETVIKIEYNDSKKFVFTTEANTKETVTEEIVKTFPSLSKVFVESKLNIETEDRESRKNDKVLSVNLDTFKEEEKNKISLGLGAALTLLEEVSGSLDEEKAGELKLIRDELNDYIENLPSNIKLESRIKNGEERARVELENEDGKIRIEVKDGELKVKTRESNKGEDNKIRNTNNIQGDINSSLEIEGDIFTNETVIKLEINDQKFSFTTLANTKAETINVIKEKFPTLTTAQIEAVLVLEVEDRSSLLEDLLNGNNDDDDDGTELEDEDDEGDDEGEDEDEDDEGDDDDNGNNSGQGGGDDEGDDD